MGLQAWVASPVEYYPTGHTLQLSVADIAPTLVEILP